MLKFLFSPAYTINNLLQKTVRKFLNPALTTLDVGCGEAEISQAFTQRSLYYGIDVETRLDESVAEQINFRIYDGKYMPFDNETFDQLLSMEVIEHVDDLDLLITEMNRVLKNRGKVIITVPFMWPEHEMPHDYRRLTGNGLAGLMEKHGFKTEKIIKLGSAPILTILCIDLRIRLRSVTGKYISYVVISPLVVACNLLSYFRVGDGSCYSNVVYVGKKNDPSHRRR